MTKSKKVVSSWTPQRLAKFQATMAKRKSLAINKATVSKMSPPVSGEIPLDLIPDNRGPGKTKKYLTRAKMNSPQKSTELELIARIIIAVAKEYK